MTIYISNNCNFMYKYGYLFIVYTQNQERNFSKKTES